jgi:hypothetical protein
MAAWGFHPGRCRNRSARQSSKLRILLKGCVTVIAFRGTVMGIRGPACSVLPSQALAIHDCAGRGGRCWAQARPWTPTVRRKRSKNQSALRPVRASHYAPSASARRGYLVVSSKRVAIVCRSSLRCKAQPSEARASPRPRFTRESGCCLLRGPGFEKPQASQSMAGERCHCAVRLTIGVRR